MRGGWPAICVNDRSDLAVLAAREGLAPWGLHLGQTDLPPSEARKLPGLGGAHLGTSTHRPGGWRHPTPPATTPASAPSGPPPPRATMRPPWASKGSGGRSRPAGRRPGPRGHGRLTRADASACFRAGAGPWPWWAKWPGARNPGSCWARPGGRWRRGPPLARGPGVALDRRQRRRESSLAEALARCLDLPARDSDRELGGPIPEVFRTEGEAGFRALEAASVARCLADPAVVALGAGAWEDPAHPGDVAGRPVHPLWLAEVPEVAVVRHRRGSRPAAGRG